MSSYCFIKCYDDDIQFSQNVVAISCCLGGHCSWSCIFTCTCLFRCACHCKVSMGNATDNFEYIDPLTTYSVTAHRQKSSSSRPALHKHTTNIYGAVSTHLHILGESLKYRQTKQLQVSYLELLLQAILQGKCSLSGICRQFFNTVYYNFYS